MDASASPASLPEMSLAQFREKYGEFCSMRGERMKLVLPLRNQQVELPLLWRMVAILGGSGEVTQGSQWPIIAEKLLSVSPNNTVAAEAVKKMFLERLAPFEQHLQKGTASFHANRVLRASAACNSAEQLPCFKPSRSTPEIKCTPPGLVKQEPTARAVGSFRPLAVDLTGTVLPPSSRNRSGSLQKQIPTANIVKQQVLPNLPEWAMKRGVFFPQPQPRRDPRQAPAALEEAALHPSQQHNVRDPRRRMDPGPATASVNDPRNYMAEIARQSSASEHGTSLGFQPLQISRAPVQPAHPSAGPKIRPLTDAYAAFQPNSQLRARVMGAVAANKRASKRASSSSDAPSASTPPFVPVAAANKDRAGASGKTGFMPLAAPQLQSVQGPPFNQQPVQGTPRPVQQRRRRGRAEEEAATSSEGSMDAAVLISPPQTKRQKQQAAPGERVQKQRQVAVSILAHRPDVAGWSSADKITSSEPKRKFNAKEVDINGVLDALKAAAVSFSPPSEGKDGVQLGDRVVGTECLMWAQREMLGRFRRKHWEDEAPLPPPSPVEQSPEPGELRRSSRARSKPAPFVPGLEPQPKRPASQEAEEDDSPRIRRGPDYQAELPQLRPKPLPGSEPTPEEAIWLGNPVISRGAFGDPTACVPIITLPENEDGERQYAVEGGEPRLLAPAEVTSLGLDRMGVAEAADWSPAEVRSFEEGLDAHRRDFERIAGQLLPEKGPLRVGSFYYNAWKTRALPEARAWYRRRQEERDRREAERRAEEAKRLEVQAAAIARRQLRESLTWLKAMARQPLGNSHKTKAERMTRATRALSRANVRVKEVQQWGTAGS